VRRNNKLLDFMSGSGGLGVPTPISRNIMVLPTGKIIIFFDVATKVATVELLAEIYAYPKSPVLQGFRVSTGFVRKPIM